MSKTCSVSTKRTGQYVNMFASVFVGTPNFTLQFWKQPTGNPSLRTNLGTLHTTTGSDVLRYDYYVDDIDTGIVDFGAICTDSCGTGTSSEEFCTISLNPLNSITITPSNPIINLGQQIQLIATCNNGLIVCPILTWSSNIPTIATVNTTTGLVTANSNNQLGTTTISAVSGSIQGTTVVTVTTTGSISGNVKNSVNNGNLPGITVSVSNASFSSSGITDSNGNYLISNIPAGTYTVGITSSVYFSIGYSGIIVAVGNTTGNINFSLTPRVAFSCTLSSCPTAPIPIGTNFNLSVSASGGVSPYTYAWTINGNPTLTCSGSSSCTGTKEAGNYTIIVTVTDSIGETCSKTCTITSELGDISCSTDPVGAHIWLDGNDTSFITPYTLTNVSSGSHTIIFKLNGYQDCDPGSINVVTGQITIIPVCVMTLISQLGVGSNLPGQLLMIGLVVGFIYMKVKKNKK